MLLQNAPKNIQNIPFSFNISGNKMKYRVRQKFCRTWSILCWLAHIRNMLSITSKPKVHTFRPGHRLSITQRRQQWLHWWLPQVLSNDGMFSAKITFLFWLMSPSLLPPVKSPGDRMWLKALSTRRVMCVLPVCSDLFTREVTLRFSDPGCAIGRRRLA